MSLHTHMSKAAMLILLLLVLAACGKQEDEGVAPASVPVSMPHLPAPVVEQAMTPADCDKLPDPKPESDSAASRAAAVSQGMAARAACKKYVAAQDFKANDDLARIRAIKEKEQADLADRKVSEEEWAARVKEGGSKPVRQFSY